MIFAFTNIFFTHIKIFKLFFKRTFLIFWKYLTRFRNQMEGKYTLANQLFPRLLGNFFKFHKIKNLFSDSFYRSAQRSTWTERRCTRPWPRSSSLRSAAWSSPSVRSSPSPSPQPWLASEQLESRKLVMIILHYQMLLFLPKNFFNLL